jgi:hypothetical protein
MPFLMSIRIIAWLAAPLVVLAISSNAIAKSYRWQCVYSQYASPKGLAKEHFTIEFAFDDITGKAVMIGSLGLADVEAHMGNNGITFLEKLVGGVVQTTTVAMSGKSVHSRHSILGAEIIPSQYYGQCRVQ